MNLDEYKEKHPRLEKRLTKMESNARIAELILDIKDHGAIKIILEELEGIVNGINAELLTHDRLETEDREKLMVDKERCLWFINLFPKAEATIKKINNYTKKL
jgi:C4-type Zn-finger protein